MDLAGRVEAMKTLLLITLCALCGCAKPEPYPVLRVRDYDEHNNRVDEKGNLVPWTNWGVGFWDKTGTNWVRLFQARENE
jgi:hypothetical protein